MSRKYINFPKQEGKISRQAHADFPEEGIYEREAGREGFFGPATHFHHSHAPTGWTNWEGPLRPRAFYLNELENLENSPLKAPSIMKNDSVEIKFWSVKSETQNLYRNADGDWLLFLHEGAGDLFCDYGHLAISEGDYVLIPRNCSFRIEAESSIKALMIEATNDSFQLPEKGLVGRHAIFDPAMLETPSINNKFEAQKNENETKVFIKKRNKVSTVTYPYNPLDVIGWHGDLSVVKINWRDIRPLMSHRYHLPPSAHTTFAAKRFVVCTFAPRPIESDKGALKVPFFHNNDDFDELLFYHKGNFFSRDNVKPGMLSLHPSGFAHGPHPKALQKSMENPVEFTDEVAVMVDTRDELHCEEILDSVEWKDYVHSWKE